MSREIDVQQLIKNRWDDDFAFATGALPPFSRLRKERGYCEWPHGVCPNLKQPGLICCTHHFKISWDVA